METRFRTEALPNCDICKATELSVIYDMPFRGTSWANCCEKCRFESETPNHPAGIRIIRGENPKAKALDPETDKATKENDHAAALNPAEIENMMFDSIVETADGCIVEPDGSCPHGFRSPLLVLGLI